MSELQVGALLKQRYRIEEKLGEGGMAVVYRAFDLQRRVAVALKLLKPDYADDSEFVRRFKREARNLQKLNHPNIVRFYEFEEENEWEFIVLDFIDGPTLRKIMRQRGQPFTPGEVLSYLRPICAALSYAHSMQVIHCDMKPANVMVDHTGRVFLNDFGIARLSESATVTFSMPGTAAYMAPEQWRGDDVVPATDVYALGIVLYELLTGRQPFTGDTIQTRGHTREKLMREHFGLAPPLASELNPQLPKAFDSVLVQCLAKEATNRFQTADDLLNAFEAACHQAGSAEVLVPRPTQGPQQTDPGVQTSQASSPQPVPAPLPPISQPVPASNVAVGSPVKNPGLLVVGGGVIVTVVLVGAVALGGGGFSVASSLATPTATVTSTPQATATSPSTSTPVPSATFSPTAIPPTETPLPTATPCFYSGVFAAVWDAVKGQLGCFTGQEVNRGQGAAQPFAGGRMYWVGATRSIYAFGANGKWTVVADTWVEGQPNYSCAAGQSANVERGFGRAWCNSNAIQSLVGRSTGGENAATVSVTAFENGLILKAEGVTRVAYNSGSWESR